MPVWADGPDPEHLDDDVEADVAPGFTALADSAGLAATSMNGDMVRPNPARMPNWPTGSRSHAQTAERAIAADSRSRGALYQAVGKAWDFALAAEDRPEAFAALLDDAGLAAQDRAPMTPIVKLVFGATPRQDTACRICLCSAMRGKRASVAANSRAYLDRYPGGLKGLVKDARARRKPERRSRNGRTKSSVRCVPRIPLSSSNMMPAMPNSWC